MQEIIAGTLAFFICFFGFSISEPVTEGTYYMLVVQRQTVQEDSTSQTQQWQDKAQLGETINLNKGEDDQVNVTVEEAGDNRLVLRFDDIVALHNDDGVEYVTKVTLEQGEAVTICAIKHDVNTYYAIAWLGYMNVQKQEDVAA